MSLDYHARLTMKERHAVCLKIDKNIFEVGYARVCQKDQKIG
jgi:hypothetical protein